MGRLQAWGHHGLFSRRETLPFPTQSGVFGLIAASLGIDRDAADHDQRIKELAELPVVVCRLETGWKSVPVSEDYHTVENARTASAGIKKTEVTRRYYLQDRVFVALIQGTPKMLKKVGTALRNPVWGTWLGRKSCVPSVPLLPPGSFPSESAEAAFRKALKALEGLKRGIVTVSSWTECERLEPGAELCRWRRFVARCSIVLSQRCPQLRFPPSEPHSAS